MSEEDKVEVQQEFVEQLFVHLYCDLGQRSEIRDDFRIYHQMNMARLLRQLLVDRSRVFDMANRYYRLPITFIVPQVGPAPDDLRKIPDLYLGQLPSSSDLLPGFYLHPYKLGAYLAKVITVLAGQEITVADVISYVANHYGGVHLSPTLEGEKDVLLSRFNGGLIYGDGGVVLAAIDNIARISLHAMRPLKDEIQKKYDRLYPDEAEPSSGQLIPPI